MSQKPSVFLILSYESAVINITTEEFSLTIAVVAAWNMEFHTGSSCSPALSLDLSTASEAGSLPTARVGPASASQKGLHKLGTKHSSSVSEAAWPNEPAALCQ